jgi:hypothetical protein
MIMDVSRQLTCPYLYRSFVGPFYDIGLKDHHSPCKRGYYLRCCTEDIPTRSWMLDIPIWVRLNRVFRFALAGGRTPDIAIVKKLAIAKLEN